MRIYLISPAPDFGIRALNNDCAIGFSKSYAMNAAAGIATVAAFFPDDMDIRLCDEIVEPVDYEDPADIIAVSMNVAQAPRGVEMARRFREKGKTVVFGGAHVSLAPQLFEGLADCLVVGEFEAIAAQFVADLQAGRLKPRYDGAKPDLATSPKPRWDLYPNHLALAGVVQTSRGCPFDCHFCDVIQYLGRVQRHKPTERVVEEVHALYDLGYRQINLSDDNFTVYRQRTRALLSALAEWNGADGREPVSFLTQMSIDVARDPDVLTLCNQAGLRFGLVGIETSNVEALKESRKRQNLKIDLVKQVETIVRAGISVQAGLMVGFDNDDLSSFERQLEFAQAMPIIVFRPAVLVAPLATPLYDQMKAAGRIVEDPKATLAPFGSSLTNIEPLQMTREQLAEGAEWLRRQILAPDNVIKRFEYYGRVVGEIPSHLVPRQGGAQSKKAAPFLELFGLGARDRDLRRVIECVNDIASVRPRVRSDLMLALGMYLNSYVRQPREMDDPFNGASGSMGRPAEPMWGAQAGA
ncbi:radical SAM protein [Aurantimonas sp. VKM B-3413]|uniref:B12-binding domain-containing radical SAM protein n=1 Tax=Aurantimonas sp. VKM B-3413 TaxID=2779401 RepID=UPI001E2DE815|nr:radical SAM protein [Aurantimonas sp. VKM B-3413]MCB8839934.1 B12-binding domain-containing radical SAM protein [Aurantimonas sp. VKM B-3413]